MHKTGWMVRTSPRGLMCALRVSAVALGIGVVVTSGVARAQDDDDNDQTFEEKIIGNIMHGLGATNMDSAGIDYRERSPLVVPPKLDLPPPVSASSEVTAPNWPKDPDIARRKAEREANRKPKPTPWEAGRTLTPSELNVGRKAASGTAVADSMEPGTSQAHPMLSPSQLGFKGGLGSLFGGSKSESAPFKGEPPRESLVEPPPGYQTPSPDYAYGTGPQAPLNGKHYDIMSGKEHDNY